jgi:sugar lactone lactonase YvrE
MFNTFHYEIDKSKEYRCELHYYLFAMNRNKIFYSYSFHLIKIYNNVFFAFQGEITLSPNASWNQTAVTIAGWTNATDGSSLSQLSCPFGLSITNNDILYISDAHNHRIVVVDLNSTANKFSIGSGQGSSPSQFSYPNNNFIVKTSLYVLDTANRRVQKLSLNGSDPITVFRSDELNQPFYLYVDNNDNIYVSDTFNYRVLLVHSNSTNFTIVAGTGVQGPNNDQLNWPYGVFVNHNKTIYIADRHNHRIMKWFSEASAGILAAGDGSPGSSSTQLNEPTHIIVDVNEYMYISDGGNARIIRWASNSNFGLCIAACTSTVGTALTQLNGPHSLAFDSYGSLYVSDYVNHRVQKFQILYSVGE